VLHVSFATKKVGDYLDENVECQARDRPASRNTTLGKEKIVAMDTRGAVSSDVWLAATRAVLKNFFSERRLAGQEGLLGWELDYICGRIVLDVAQAPGS
jgi:hypothetical protein